MKKNSKRWLGASLLLLAVFQIYVGVGAITSFQTVMIKAFSSEPRSTIEQMVTAWPDLVLPLVVCISVAAGIFLIAAALAFTGKLTINYTVKN
ncbi:MULTISPECIES: hypothetical protein [Pseudomonas]|uniref:hypothetical protein n=1 Tax=Pseudomonas TaxID=286 RepID=UPI00186630CF|nr:hypothetical protein [Pseudomonas lundensis]